MCQKQNQQRTSISTVKGRQERTLGNTGCWVTVPGLDKPALITRCTQDICPLLLPERGIAIQDYNVLSSVWNYFTSSRNWKAVRCKKPWNRLSSHKWGQAAQEQTQACSGCHCRVSQQGGSGPNRWPPPTAKLKLTSPLSYTYSTFQHSAWRMLNPDYMFANFDFLGEKNQREATVFQTANLTDFVHYTAFS